MRFALGITSTIEEMKEMRMSAIDHEDMIRKKLFGDFVDKLQQKLPDAITEHQDIMRLTIEHNLTLYVETEKEREQKRETLYEILNHYDIPKSALHYIFMEVL